jgi:hypothetical protein
VLNERRGRARALRSLTLSATLALLGCNSILGNEQRSLAQVDGSAAASAGADNGSGGTTTMSMTDGGADPCVGVTCDEPPADECESDSQFKTYDKIGSCSAGQCSYASQMVACTCVAGACTTDPCLGVACSTPPSASCFDESTQLSYASTGTCAGGSCSYTATKTPCAFGCSDGVCNADPCVGVICDHPPPNVCASAGGLTAYDTMGSCSGGTCSYGSQLEACTCVSGACTTDPCVSVTCSNPPTPICSDSNTRRVYAAAGTCSGGSCSYSTTDTACPFGCANGACKADPCLGVTCNSPPATTCANSQTRTVYASPGTCSGGVCSYSSVSLACGSNQQCSTGQCTVCGTSGACGSTCSACPGSTPRCEVSGSTSQCVQCLSNADCPFVCINNVCGGVCVPGSQVKVPPGQTPPENNTVWQLFTCTSAGQLGTAICNDPPECSNRWCPCTSGLTSCSYTNDGTTCICNAC